MPARDPAPPLRATPLDSITPSLVVGMKRCLLRVAFSRSGPHRRLVSHGPAARLGTAAHEVLELVGKGQLDEHDPDSPHWRAAYEALWRDAVERQDADARQSLVDNALGPPDRWPFYSMRRGQTRVLARQLSRRRWSPDSYTRLAFALAPLDSSPVTHAAPAEPCGSESILAGFGGRLQGRADNIEIEDDGVCIEDFKTGAIYEHVDDPLDQPRIKGDYRLQLLLYAALYHDATGVWPARLRLIPFSGPPETIEMDEAARAEATQAARESLALLDRYNQAATSGRLAHLAIPAPSACRDCPFRGPCDAYWSRASASWQPNEHPSCAGVVQEVRELSNATIALTIAVRAGAIAPGIWRIRGLTPDQVTGPAGSISPGDAVRIVNLRQREGGAPDELWGRHDTEVWRLSVSATPGILGRSRS